MVTRRVEPTRSRALGQALVELALVLPLFLMVFVGIITLGMGIFFQQQVTNAAREAARYAAIHSATAQRPVVGWLDPNSEDPPGTSGTYAASIPDSYVRWDEPDEEWPDMTAHARNRIFGLDPNAVFISACWSGYRDGVAPGGAFDAPPDGVTVDIGGVPYTYQTRWAQCSIDGQDPTNAADQIGCGPGLATVDQASSMSEGPGVIIGNRVTAYACYNWTPPLAGFLLVPQKVTLRGVITEPIQRQQ